MRSRPADGFASVVASVPPPLAIGAVHPQDDGATVPGFVATSAALEGARDITAFGGWRDYVRSGER